MEMNACAGANFRAADVALNKVYAQVMAAESEDSSRKALRGGERTWIAYRDRECAFEVGSQQTGGSIWPMEMSNCLEEKTAARIRELMKLRDCDSRMSNCPAR